MAEARARTRRARPASARRDEVILEEVVDGERPESSGRPSCSFAFCPICTALTAIGEARPELVDHLMMASREMLLAVRGLIDARLERAGRPPPPKLERLTIE